MTKKYRNYKFRIYPNKTQQDKISNTIGCSRFVYNHFLNAWENQYKSTKKGMSYYQCCLSLTQLKKDLQWLRDVDSHALQSSLKHLSHAYDNFFNGVQGHPKFKKKGKSKNSYTTNIIEKWRDPKNSICRNKIKLPILGWVKLSMSKEVEGLIKKVSIVHSASDKYFIYVVSEEEISHMPKTGSTVGIDLGIKDLCIVSNGTIYKNGRYFKSLEEKLAREQRKLSRRQLIALNKKIDLYDAKNYQKQKLKVAKIHEKIANKRKDFLHKVSTDIVKNHDIIGLETLNIEGMLKNRRLSKAISDASWGTLVNMISYKAEWYGKNVIRVPNNFASSQLCSNCGFKNIETKNLSLRNWICPNCNKSHDRDLNAAINIKTEAIRILNQLTAGDAELAW